MGQKPSSHPSVKSITEDVGEIRRSIKRDKAKIDEDSKQQLQGVLVGYSQQVNSLAKKSKKKDVDNAQKLISEVTSELLTDTSVGKSEDNLDMASVETNSFIHVSNKTQKVGKSETLEKTEKLEKTARLSPKRKRDPHSVNTVQRLSSITLNDIESKFDSIKLDAKVAIANSDRSRLNFLSKSIENLATNLELIPVDDHMVLRERKENLEKKMAKLYSRVNNIRKQITRDDHIDYLTKLQSKHSRGNSLSKLDEIRQVVANIDVDDLLRKGIDQLESTKRDLTSYKDEVAKLEDHESAKNDVLSLIRNLQENIETALGKARTERVVQEKLGQAEESHERFKSEVNRFSKPRQSEDYTNYRKYLTQLKDYVSKIPEINQDVADRKQFYLRDVERSLDTLEQKAQTIERRNSREDQQVVIRHKQIDSKQSFVSDRTVDGLYIYWKELEENIVVEKLNQEELWTMYNMLNTLIVSVSEKNSEIRNYLKRNQNGQPDTISTKSDETDDVVKVKVKITESPATSPNSDVKTKENAKKIEDITKELHNLKNRIDNSSSLSNEDREQLKNILESHRKTLNRLSIYRNENVRNSAHDLRKSIDKILSHLNEKSIAQVAVQSRKSSSEDILKEIMTVGTKVNELDERCKPFSNINQKDYDLVKNSLIEHQNHLKSIDISSYSGNIKKARDDILDQISACLNKLEDMVQITEVNPSEKEFRQELQSLREKVSRFTGAYKNVLYKKIEDDLNNCLLNVARKIQDPVQARILKNDIESQLKILEEKSVKDGHYNDSLTRKSAKVPPPVAPKPARLESVSTKLSRIREDVNQVVFELNQSSAKTREEYVALDGRLTLSILALDNLTIVKNKQFSDERNQLYDSIQKQLSFISEKIAFIDTPTGKMMAQKFQNSIERKKNSSESVELDRIENDIKGIRAEVQVFVGLEDSQKFLDLDDFIIHTTFKLKNLKLDKSSDLYDKKVRLFIELQELSETLERRLKETERIMEIEQELREILIKLDSFSEADYNILDEQLINLNVKLHKLNVNEELLPRKNKCVQEISECLKKLGESAHKKRDVVGEGTFV